MLNSPGPFHGFDPPQRRPALSAGTQATPRIRILLLGVICLAPLLLVAARFAHVQLTLGGDYAAEFDRTSERVEPIPSRDGRILAHDGQVLAEDVESYRLSVHYRWLEDPPDPGWLRSQALHRLDRGDRRVSTRVAAAEHAVLEQRDALWQRLAAQPGIDPDQLARNRRGVQRRVEQIHRQVERRRHQRSQTEPASRSKDEIAPQQAGLKGDIQAVWLWMWNRLVAALTTPPRREETEPLVIQEQLDYHVVYDDLPLELAVEIESHGESFPGTRIETTSERVYPQGELAAHVVGHRLRVTAEQLAARRERFPLGDPLDYQPGDRMGITGLERHHERTLRGLRGKRVLVLNRRGEIVQERVVREPRLGSDLVVSLSVDLQRAAETLLDAALAGPQVDETNGKSLPTPTGGAIVVLDVRTGAVLAAASGPRFDPRVLTAHDSAGWKAILEDPRQPLFHRAVEMALPPGSIFKVVSSIGFLESGRLDPERSFTCLGYLDSPERHRCYTFKHHGVGHGDVSLVGAIARSCNVYFFDAARTIGREPLVEWADRLGLGRVTGIDLPGERKGSLPAVEVAGEPGRTQRGSGETLQLVIGQGKLTATPLQISRLMAAVANGGRLVTPRLSLANGVVRSQEDAGEASETVDTEPQLSLSPRTLAFVRRGLAEVVANPQGTGYKTVRLNEVPIAGKTGTAESGGGRPDHAWFAGYVPANRPRVAFVVVLEHAGPGGHAAGPVARKLVQAMLEGGTLNPGAARMAPGRVLAN